MLKRLILLLPLALAATPLFATTALTDGSTIALDASLDSAYTLTLGGDDHLLASPTNVTADKVYTLAVTQDATGGHQLLFGAGYDLPLALNGVGAASVEKGANALVIYTFVGRGSQLSLLSVASGDSAAVQRPTGLTASTNQTGQVTLSWTSADASATAYSVWKNDPVFGWGQIATPTGTSYVDTEAAGNYTYRIQATRLPAVSPYTPTVTGTAL